MDVSNGSITPNPAEPGEEVTVSLDYFVSGTSGHIIYVGLALDDECVGEFYHGVPGQTGASGFGEITFNAPSAAGCHPLYVAVAHVYNYAEFCEAIAEGGADTLMIGRLTVPLLEEFPGPDLAPYWQPIGNGEWSWDSEGDGIAKQTHGPQDDNCSVLKLLDSYFGDFELTVRWRQDAGPTISSGMNVCVRMGDEPGEGANVAGIGPYYSVGWCMTPPGYGHPDFWLTYYEGYNEVAPDVYWRAGGDLIAAAALNDEEQWFTLGDWRRTRVRAIGSNIKVYVDHDSSDPATDSDEDFVLIFDVTDSRLCGGAVALDDHYANSSWDYVHVEPICGVGDLNCDGAVNNFDIDPFVMALTDPGSYAQQFPHCDRMLADCNDDGEVNNFDIDAFVDLLTGC